MARGVVFPVGGSWAREGLPAPGGPLEGLNPAVGQATNAFEVALARIDGDLDGRARERRQRQSIKVRPR